MVFWKMKFRRGERKSSGGDGLRTSMRGCHAQSCQTTAMKRRHGTFPDFVSAHIKISLPSIVVDLHLFAPVANEIFLGAGESINRGKARANRKLNPQVIRIWIVDSGRKITPGIQAGRIQRLVR